MTLTVDDRELIEELWDLHRRGVSYASDKPAVNMLLADLAEGIRKSTNRLQSLLSDVGRLSEAATKARDKFLHYEDLHRTKCTADGDEKADRNREMADMLTAALTQTEVP